MTMYKKSTFNLQSCHIQTRVTKEWYQEV